MGRLRGGYEQAVGDAIPPIILRILVCILSSVPKGIGVFNGKSDTPAKPPKATPKPSASVPSRKCLRTDSACASLSDSCERRRQASGGLAQTKELLPACWTRSWNDSGAPPKPNRSRESRECGRKVRATNAFTSVHISSSLELAMQQGTANLQ